jgi:hypothetical protein
MTKRRLLLVVPALVLLACCFSTSTAEAASCFPAPAGSITGGSCSLVCDGYSGLVRGEREVHVTGVLVTISLQFDDAEDALFSLSCSGTTTCTAFATDLFDPTGLSATCTAEGAFVLGDLPAFFVPATCSC